MFRKKPILHKLKPNCKTCKYKTECDKTYNFCNKHTGFITPCYSCEKIVTCITYKVHNYKGWHVMECPDWIYDKVIERLKIIEVQMPQKAGPE